MNRRNFLLNLLLGILSFIFGYRVGNSKIKSGDVLNEEIAQIAQQAINVLNPPKSLNKLTGYSKRETAVDESEKLQSIIDYLNTRGGGVILFPPNMYFKFSNISISYNNIKFIGNGTTFVPTGASTGIAFEVSNSDSIEFHGINFDFEGSGQRVINGGTVNNFKMSRCKLFGGTEYGLKLHNVVNCKIYDNEISDFDLWGLYIKGSNGLWIQRNKAFNHSSYDGIKIGSNQSPDPIIVNKNVFITHNVCFGNGRDGVDCATNEGENINITYNICYNNGYYGLNVKRVYQGNGVNRLNVTDNILNENNLGGIEIIDQKPNIYTGEEFKNIIISKNIIKHSSNSSSVDKGEIKIINLKHCHVKDNILEGGFIGIRGCGVNESIIEGNTIKDTTRCINFEQDMSVEWNGAATNVTLSSTKNKIINNDLTADGISGSLCIRLAGTGSETAVTTDTIVERNKIKNPTSIQQTMLDQATNTVFIENVSGFGSSAPTTDNHSKFETWINNNPTAGSYEKWLCLSGGTPGTWKGVNLIEA